MKRKAVDALKHKINGRNRKKSIFRALFGPLFVIMILQAFIFYVSAVYGGVEETMNQNAADIIRERLVNRKNEIETLFTNKWSYFDDCEKELFLLYEEYEADYGKKPLTENVNNQMAFLEDAASALINTLRENEVNGIYLIINDREEQMEFDPSGTENKIGLCIRDFDQNSNYNGTEDLLLERAPSSLIEKIDCKLDSWWEARYTFTSEENGAFYYYPLKAAWENHDADGEDLAYFQGAHRISDSDQEVVSYSIPLMDREGYPYAVLGVEITTKYLASLLPSMELDDSDKSCYVLALETEGEDNYRIITGNGATYSRCFGTTEGFPIGKTLAIGGFYVMGRDDTKLYADKSELEIYNNNNPFDSTHLILIAMIEEGERLAYINHVKRTLAIVSLISLFLGLCGIIVVSRFFSKPITLLAKRVQSMSPQDGFQLGRLGILEIDQLVDSIEELNRNASRNIARTEFFSRMSHDMRTPMNAIISFSSNELLDGTSEEQKVEYLEKIHSSGQYLLGLINEVLDMTKIESNKIDLQFSPVRTSQLWDTLISIIEKLAQKKKINFIKDVYMEDTVVMVDEQHLNQIVMNLLSNAVKFTPENGTVKMSVRVTSTPEESGQLQCCIVISDSGIGMSEEFMKNLYHPFLQENEGREGTGLGLSIAKKLVELMDGTIECISKKNSGTTFTVKLTFRKCSEDELADKKKRDAEDAEAAAEEDLGLRGKRILVCEDHPLNMQIITRLLERAGIEPVAAYNGQVGADLFAASLEGYFDAVLMDIRMPEMDGLETARTIRSFDRKDAMKVPIIAMTANAFSEDVEASTAAGMNAHLSKPVEPQKLYKTLSLLIKSQ